MEKIKTYQEDGILFVILNSPETLNALSSKILSELDMILDEIWYMKLKGVIISGEGRAFSAGADISELNSLENIHQAYEYLRRGQRILSKMEKLKYITCAAIDGYALGGGFELALACTFRIATKKSKVGLPEINLGIIPGYGGTQRLTRLVGPQKAKHFIMSGEFISADKAFELGILDDICETREELLDKAKKLILQFEGKNPTALRYISELCNLHSDGFFEDNMKTEALFCASLISSQFAKNKMQEFLEKKKK
ncbi:MAG: enoyl-CoA hydratase/isomerase family protein [Candidatus Calescibacterium sp.]|jgi:enoyl-CoA hydratase/carnithine racemase